MIDPHQQVSDIRDAAAMQWERNQRILVEHGLRQMTEHDYQIFLGGWMQGAGWAHKRLADMLKAKGTR